MRKLLFTLLALLMISITGAGVQKASANSNNFDSMYSFAKTYIGVPYRLGGTTRSGIDCSAYTQVVFSNNGTSIPRTTSQQFSIGTPVAKSNLQQGDLVFFNTMGRGVSHVGIYVGNNNFIHASTSRGVMISSINDPYYWGSRYIGAKRVKNFSTGAGNTTEVAQVEYLTRSDVAEMLANELNITGDSSSTSFNDVDTNHPQLAEINAVTAAGIFSGNNGKFNPNDSLTRAEMAKVLVESFELVAQSQNVAFKDVAVSNWANPYIQTLYSLGITKGTGNGEFGVNDKITKQQLNTFIERIRN